jgi:hypothetical protein
VNNRREFISLIGGAAAWPLAARAQEPAHPVIGYLSARSPDDTWHLAEASRRGLRQGGFVEVITRRSNTAGGSVSESDLLNSQRSRACGWVTGHWRWRSAQLPRR